MEANNQLDISQEELKGLAGKYLTFYLQEELYGIEILKVQEINGLMPITRVPKAPEEIKGVINLRGRVVPVIDLRLKLGMPPKDYNDQTCIVVVNVPYEDQTIAVGVIVDSVQEVRDLAASQLEPAPRFGFENHTNMLLAVGKIEECVVLLLDIDRAIGSAEALKQLALESN